ncbi:MAG: helicase [Microvirga sp.]|jgi:very-short-patch-repair endonuclease|nr:helicase [Microvirga sp.]
MADVDIKADIAPSFTYASFQNAIPVVRSVVIVNRSAQSFERCSLELFSNPPFIRAKTWTIDRLLAGDSISLSDRKIDLDAAYLAGLNEAERGEITLRLSCGNDVLVEQHITVRLLARDEWGGVADMAQLLPAFVMPNDPAVAYVLRAAAERLVAHGHPGGLDGYQTGNPQRAFTLAAALYSAVAGMALHYAEPPASFEHRGQKVRRPSTIAAERLATCLDTTLLFAAGLEAAGLHAIVLMFQGHAGVGVWLTPRTFSDAVENDPIEVRKALAARELIIFETTGVTHRPAMTLEAARRVLEQRFDEAEAMSFVAAIDIRRLRSGGIMPLASHDPLRRAVSEEETGEVAVLPLPPAPAMDELPAAVAEVKPTTAAGRIDRWQKKLLDLTLRNRLLNFPDSKKTIPFLCTDVGYLEDRLANGTSIRLISLPEQNPLGERDARLYREVHGRDLQRGFAAEALLRDELPSTLDAKQLEARLIDLHRQVKNDFAEGGANTLFMAVGFLRWKKKPDDERSYRAPLLLVPVKLDHRSANSRFSLQFHEDEPRFNATLLQFLERDFELRLPQFAGELPRDENGVDVPRLLATMRQAIRDVPGMEVLDETALSTFSFAKFLMWKDLVERTDALRENRVVRHLIDTPDQPFQAADANPFRDERDLDRHYQPSDIVCLLPADSSQLAASLAAAEGHDFVIVGPPGTGKSQTIANMIANCLAVGKTVLFVAEKTAALDVVYRRLREHGLGDHCLELHSNKADRRRFLAQLKASWESGQRLDASQWIAVNGRLQLRRDELNAYVDALHRRHGNGWTTYQAMGLTLKEWNRYAPSLSWAAEAAPDEAALHQMEQVAGEVGLAFGSVVMNPALHMVDVPEWTSAWQDNLQNAAQALGGGADALGKATGAFLASLGLRPQEDVAKSELDAFCRLATALKDSAGHDIRIVGDRDFAQLRPALSTLAQTIDRYHAAEAALTAGYRLDTLDQLDLDAADAQWRRAATPLWPSSALGKRKVRGILQLHMAGGEPDPARDLPLLRVIKECRAEAAASPLAGKALPFAGLGTDIAAMDRFLRLAEGLRAALRLPLGREELQAVFRKLGSLLSGDAPEDRIRPSAERLLASLAHFNATLRHFGGLAGRTPVLSAEEGRLAGLRTSLGELSAVRHLLRDWSAWCRVRRNATRHGLDALVDDVEQGSVPAGEARAAFRLAYARWWLRGALDADPVLRSFRRFQHENAISDFREIDDLVRAHAAHRVVSAITHGLPSVQSVPRNSELGLLRHQMDLQRPSRSIREMIGALPTSFARLAPCMLMSPLSIAQYLPPDQALFDVVIFDEASQITTWDAVGAIARARQTIIVGDPKQLPPTNFFGRNEEDEEALEHEKDLESILDEAKAAGIALRDLRWHYRSRSESLIAFSNHYYYQNRLVTFPSPAVEDRAVQLRKVPSGIYDRGKSRTNRIEAEHVAAEAVSRMRGWLALGERARPTLGIITFNAQQQSLILDLLDRARRAEPALEWFFAEERIEPTIVKNLENVQGDERDVILFSITFSRDAADKRLMDFGALNRDGGERRLNVAITRARQQLIVFSGFTADLIAPTRTKAIGIHHLKAFLDFAERGAIALPAQDSGSMGGFDSAFEEAVAAELEQRGWTIVPQVGISGFRVDLGVRHPDLPGAYLAGVECDGATYHGSATARDRDKVREQVLRGLGWNIMRVWSTDWWFDAQGCADRLHQHLESALEADRSRRARPDPADATTHWDMGHEVEPVEPVPDEIPVPAEEPTPPLAAEEEIEIVEIMPAPPPAAVAAHASAPHELSAIDADAVLGGYRMVDLSGFGADPERYHDLDYRDTLRAMIAAVIDQEGPLRADILAQRIARAHGWLRTGGKIRERIDLLLREVDTTSESSGLFVWKKGSVAELLEYRAAADPDFRRGVADIPLAELASVVVANPALLEQPDPAVDLARLLGVERLAASARLRLDEAIERAKPHLVNA